MNNQGAWAQQNIFPDQDHAADNKNLYVYEEKNKNQEYSTVQYSTGEKGFSKGSRPYITALPFQISSLCLAHQNFTKSLGRSAHKYMISASSVRKPFPDSMLRN